MASFVHPTFGLLALLPIPARAPFRESLGFLTEVHPAYDGGEARIQLRGKPRQRLTTAFTAQPDKSKAVFNTVYGGMAARWAIPVWPQARSCGIVPEAATVVPVNTQYADFRAGDPVLFLGPCGDWYVSMVDEVAPDGLTLATGTPSEIRGAYVIPIRVGRVVSSGQKDTSGYGADWELTYEVDDNLLWAPAAPTQYYGDDIYLTPGLLEGDSLGERVFTNLETFDYGLGAVKAFTPWLNNRTSRPYRVITESDAEAWALRGWLHRRLGRYRPFWQPSFENDARLVSTGNLVSSVQIVGDDRNPWAMNRKNLAFGLRDGTWLPRRVVSDVASGVGLRTVGLDAPLNVDAANVMAVSYMGLKRLEGDTIDLTWLGNGRCEMSASVLELSP